MSADGWYPDIVGGVGNILAGSQVGPASYVTGGFVINPAAFTSLHFMAVEIAVLGALPIVVGEITRNSPAGGQATVRLIRSRFNDTTAAGMPTNAPAGVTVAGASGALVVSEAAHTHGVGTLVAALDGGHDHGVGTLANAGEAAHTHGLTAISTGSAGVHNHAQSALTALTVDAGGVGNATRVSESTGSTTGHTHTIAGTSDAGASHTHTLSGTVAASVTHSHALSGASGAGASHQHAMNTLYSHDHPLTIAAADAIRTEVGAGTVLSDVTFRWFAFGTPS